MTIFEALEKAKRLRKEREAADVVAAVSPSRPPAPKVLRAEPQAPRVRTPDFVRIKYDPRSCAQNRILVPDDQGPPKPGARDAYNMLRTRLLQRARSNNWTSIAITSPGPDEGKSVTALNLSLSIAREKNNSVFLLDLDFRSPSVCRHLGISPKTEIIRFFTGEVGPESVFFSIGVENLSLAGGLMSAEQSSDLLANGRLEQLFAYIRTIATSPLIIADMAPVLSTADVLVVAPKVDATLLVVGQGKTRRDSLATTVELLSDYRVAGIVLNRSQELLTEYYGSRPTVAHDRESSPSARS
jgi:Mrp family chromosome partitioning ATPase